MNPVIQRNRRRALHNTMEAIGQPTNIVGPLDERPSTSMDSVMLQTLHKYGYDLQEPIDHVANGGGDTDGGGLTLSPTGIVNSAASIFALRNPKMGQTAMHLAVRKGHVDVLKALLNLPQYDTCVNVQDRHGNTALHFAASSSKAASMSMTQLLLQHGADPYAVNRQGQTPYYTHLMLLKSDVPDITKLFVQDEIDLNSLVNGTTYLHMALHKELMNISCELVAAGASINVPNLQGKMVSDTLNRKTLVRLCRYMTEGVQAPPKSVPRKTCKLCKLPPNVMESLHDCKLCGRCACRPCSKKASEVKLSNGVSIGSSGRYCTTCSTALQLRDMQQKNRSDFQERMFGTTW